MVDHVGHAAFAHRELLGDDAGIAFFAVDKQVLDGFVFLAVDFLHDDAGTPDAELIAFAAHGFDDDGHLELAATLHGVVFFVARLLDADAHVAQAFFHQTLVDLTGLHVLAFQAGVGAVVAVKVHGHRRFVDGEAGKGFGAFLVAYGVANFYVFDTAEDADIAGADFIGLGKTDARIRLQLGHLEVGGLAVFAEQNQRLAGLHRTVGHAANAQTAHIVAVVEVADHHLEGGLWVVMRGRQAFNNGIKQGVQVGPRNLELFLGNALPANGVVHRKVELVFVGV